MCKGARIDDLVASEASRGTYDKTARELEVASGIRTTKEERSEPIEPAVLRNFKMAASVAPIDSHALSSDSSQGTASISISLRSSIKYVSRPPRWLLCPVCDQLLLEPVIAVGCGHTFCRSCSERLKETNRPCPLDNTPSGANNFVPNRALGAQIDELEVYCPNSSVQTEASTSTAGEDVDQSSGCSESMKLGELSDHLTTCPFGLVDCPQAGEVCGRIHRKDLAHHLEVCQRCSCINCTVGKCCVDGACPLFQTVSVHAHAYVSCYDMHGNSLY